MGLFGELHRRNVLRVAAAYCIVAWLLIQVSDIVFPRLGLPEWTVTFVIVLLAIGFPMALVISWCFELTPEGLKLTQEVHPDESIRHITGRRLDFLVIGILSVAIIVLLLRQFEMQATVNEARSNQGAAIMRQPADEFTSIAVLPFRNLSEDAGNAYFGEGIAEEILNALMKLPTLQVVGSTSSFSYRGKDLDLQELGDRLNADYILEGSVRRGGDQVRITAQLSNTENGFNLWSDTYDTGLQDIFSVQEQLSRAIVDALKLELLPEETAGLGRLSTRSTEAYDLYLQGRNIIRHATSTGDYDRATELFNRALAIDPQFAEAIAGKCEALVGKIDETFNPDFVEPATMICKQAETMAADSPQVQLALGNLYLQTGREEPAIEAFRQAMMLAPALDAAHLGLANALVNTGRMEEAEPHFMRAIELMPKYAGNHISYAAALFHNGQYDHAAEVFRRAIMLEPDNPRNYSNLGAALSLLGRFEEANQAYRRSIALRPNERAYNNLGTSLYYSGQFEEAVQMYRRAVELQPEKFSYRGALADACRNAATCADARSHYLQALELVNRALEINPNNASILAKKAEFLSHLDRAEESRQLLARALESGTNDPQMLAAAARIAGNLGDRALARQYAAQAIAAGYPQEWINADPDIPTAALKQGP